jgi:phosphoribosylformimino-5-aminoimidazole carboxamide ribotide isomerase
VKLIPAIDLRDGQCVRLYQGKFDRQTNYNNDPVSLAQDYRALGCEELHIVDLDGARLGRQQNQEIIRAIVETSQLTVQLGGGVRSESALETWLRAGVSRVVIGSLAVSEPQLVADWLARYGTEKIVLALDVNLDSNGTPRVTTHVWTRQATQSLWHCIDQYAAAEMPRILCTDISRDGALTGPNINLYLRLVERYPDIRLQASGGIRNLEDLEALQKIGASAAISGRALLDGNITAGEIRTFLLAA